MDIFYEQMIKPKKRGLDFLKVFLGAILGLGLTLLCLMIDLLGLNLLAIFFIWWGYVKLLKGINVEYEYSITNHEFDIDVIRGKSTRKHITTINLNACKYFGKVSNPKTILEMANTTPDKTYYFVGDKTSSNLYVTDVLSRKDNSKIRVFIEPNEQMAEYIRLANPKAFIGE